jgi:ATP-dependent RNA helicase DDX5/DBP2
VQLKRGGFEKPFPIQAQSWPLGLQGRSLVAVAKTGSGKTLGYLLPGLVECLRKKNDPRKGPTVLVLAPTRELANQIQEEAVKFGRVAGLSSVVSGFVSVQDLRSCRCRRVCSPKG